MTKLNLYSKEQIDALDIGKSTDAASATGSLWARIKNALSRIGTNETNITALQTGKADDNAVVKLTGDQTISGTKTFSASPTVPTAPAATTSAVNSAYVNDSTDGVNNIVHKSGNEIVTGEKIFNLPYVNNQYWVNYGNLDLDKFNLPSTDPDYISSVQIPWNIIKLTKGATLNSDFIGYSQIQLLHSNITYADNTTEVCNKVMYRQTIRGAKPDSTFTNQGATMDFETIWSTKYNKKIDFVKATYRTNTSEIPYDNYEVVTIGMLKHLGLIS